MFSIMQIMLTYSKIVLPEKTASSNNPRKPL